MQNGLRAAAAALLLVVVACAPKAQPAEPPAPKRQACLPRLPLRPPPYIRSGSDQELILSTTTSTQDSGLLDVLVPLFEQETGHRVKTVSVGAGAALALGARGEADVIAGACARERKAVDGPGMAPRGYWSCTNDFVLVGPPGGSCKSQRDVVGRGRHEEGGNRPGAPSSPAATTPARNKPSWRCGSKLRSIPSGTTVVRRERHRHGPDADDRRSEAGLHPERPRDLVGMGGQDRLPVLIEGDKALFNVYHVMPVNRRGSRASRSTFAGRQSICEFLLASATQVIGSFGRDKYGQALFVPDAVNRT